MMDLELRISQYIDGELSGEEEAELHHMLAVSPEARALFREHLTLHTVARDERVLHRPTQVMRDDLFARLHAEEGMKPAAAVLTSTATGAAVLSGGGNRVVEDRPPIASNEDQRTEERRRRRRVIPILIPLLLCVIVGGIWYGGGFDGSGDSENYAGIQSTDRSNRESSGGASNKQDNTTTGIPETTNDDQTLAMNGTTQSAPAEAFSSDRPTADYQPAPPPEAASYRAAPRRSATLEEETIASHFAQSEPHDVLAIRRPSSPALESREREEEENSMLDLSPVIADAEEAYSYDDTSPELAEGGDDIAVFFNKEEVYPPLENGVSITLSPKEIENPTLIQGSLAVSNANGIESINRLQVNGLEINDPISSTMSNSIPLGSSANPRHYGLRDSISGEPIRPTIDRMDEYAALLQQEGLEFGGDSMSFAFSQIMVDGNSGNTGSRAINESWAYKSRDDVATENLSEGKGYDQAPIVMADRKGIKEKATSDSAIAIKDVNKAEENIGRGRASAPVADNRNVAVENYDYESVSSDSPLSVSASAPRRPSFFVGLDQSLGATVSAVEVSIPSPSSNFSSFSGNRGISSETRAVFGFQFDEGRQRVFATVGGWTYDERESFRNVKTTSGSVNTIQTIVREGERSVYEFWGGAGYRYTVHVTRDWNVGAEAWGGVGGNFVHAGLSAPVSYELRENLQLEIVPGIRYRDMHSTPTPVTGGVGTDDYTERLVTPRDESRMQTTVGIGLILLLR